MSKKERLGWAMAWSGIIGANAVAVVISLVSGAWLMLAINVACCVYAESRRRMNLAHFWESSR